MKHITFLNLKRNTGFLKCSISFIHRETISQLKFSRLMKKKKTTKKQNDLCAQRRLRSALTSAKSDQSLRCALSG